MPWCPKCKTEYQEGITQCADCGSDLVDCLKEDLVCVTTLPEETALGLLSYYEYLGVDYCILEFDKDSGSYHVMVPRSKEQEISRPTNEYFAKLSSVKKKSPDTPEEKSSSAVSNGSYKNKADRLEDTRSTAYSFLLVGGIGLILVILFASGILPFPFGASGKVMMLGVMGLLFLVFLVIGALNLKKLSVLSSEASEEDKKIQEILSWFLDTFTADRVDAGCELTDSEEINYYRRAEFIKEQLKLQYPGDDAFLDSLTETIYSKLYD